MAYRSSSSSFICLAVAAQLVTLALSLSPHLTSCFSKTTHVCTIQVVNQFPHDPAAYTEGLLYGGNNTLYESTGLYGKSSVRKVNLQTGKVETLHKMANNYFGEGLTLIGQRLYQLTWLLKIGFIYDRKDLSIVRNFTHQMNDGWGLATDGRILFGSDGSSTLYQIDPHTMTVMQKLDVRYNDLEVRALNELEFVNGEIWANVFTTDCIVRISPKDGTVLGWVVLPILRETLIVADEINYYDVLNGIAWDSDNQRLFVTGKLWPKIFEIKVVPMEEQAHVDIEQLCFVNVPSSSDLAEV